MSFWERIAFRIKRMWPVYLIFIGIIAAASCSLLFMNFRTAKNEKITDEEWAYMIDYINEEFGQGEEMHVINRDVESIIKKNSRRLFTNYLGVKVAILGYFDSQEELFLVSFVRYNEDYDDKIHKEPFKAGEIRFNMVVTTHNKSEYFDSIEGA